MKRKLISKMLILTFMLVGIGMISSCKDYDEDMYSELKGNQNTLESTLQKQIASLQAQLSKIKSCNCNIDSVLNVKNYLTNSDFTTAISSYVTSAGLSSTLGDYLKSSNFATEFNKLMANYQVAGSSLTTVITDLQENIKTANATLGKVQSMQTTLSNNLASVEDKQKASDSIISILVSTTKRLNDASIEAASTTKAAMALAQRDSQRIDNAMVKIAEIANAVLNAQNKADAAYDKASDNATKILELTQNVSNFNKTVSDMQAVITKLESTVVSLNAKLDTAYTNASDAKILAQKNAAWIDAFVNSYKAYDPSKVDSIIQATKSLSANINEVKLLAESNFNLAKLYTDSVANAVKSDLISKINSTNDKIDATNTKIDATNIKVKDLQDSYNSECLKLESAIDQLNKDVAAVNAKLTTLTNAINARFTDVLTKLVTGIIVQGTDNPVFGSIALPLGIRSNVLMAYYGTNVTPGTREFPYYKSTYEANYESANSFSSTDLAFLKNNCGTTVRFINNGATLLDDSIGNAGTIYLTINPSNTDFSNLPVTLVNSQDVASGVMLGALKKSDKTLTFGYTRASSNNGFYEAPATLSADKIDNVKINIESGLKSSMKDALTALKNKSTNIDITGLVSNIYNQFNGKIDAEGVKTTWSDSLGEHSILSNYNIAATAIHPLSFKFLQGTSLPSLPTISPLAEINLNIDSVNFSFNPTFTINGSAAHISLSHVNFTANEIKVIINVPDVNTATVDPITNKVSWTMVPDTVKLNDLKNFVDSLNYQMNGQIDNWNTMINTELQKQVDDLVSQINTQVSAKLSDINGQLNQSVNDVLKEISDQVAGKFSSYIGKLNNYITRVNSFTSRINKFLSDPNHYLQVCMLYQGADGAYHQLSNTKAVPSVFNISGGNATSLIPTTYTAEIAAPSYLKFVAVTNVYKGNVSAQGGDKACLDALKAANNQKFMNEVITGKRLTVPFEATLTDCVYEITFSALDYSGYSSTRKFYVKVVQ